MKKWICILLLFSLSGCSNNEKAIVCSTVSQDESTSIKLKYTYDNNKNITHIQKVIVVTFYESTLQNTTLDIKYEELKEEYQKYDAIKGLIYALDMNEQEKQIQATIDVDLSQYDFKKDSFELGKKEYYQDITEVIEEINELGYYRCEEV